MKLWTSLLFLHGHIADPALAADLAKDDASAGTDTSAARATRRTGAESRTPRTRWATTAARLLHELVYLGGRPMTAGHNDDIEEPFPQATGPASAKRSAQSKPCVTRHGAIAAVCGTVALSPFR